MFITFFEAETQKYSGIFSNDLEYSVNLINIPELHLI